MAYADWWREPFISWLWEYNNLFCRWVYVVAFYYTFCNYSAWSNKTSLFSFLAVTESYEDHREAKNLGRNDYVFDDFWRWVQSFPRFEAFIFDQEISRYKRVKRRELEGIFRDQLERLASQSRCSDDKPILNGHSRRIGEEEEEEEDEYWDDWDQWLLLNVAV